MPNTSDEKQDVNLAIERLVQLLEQLLPTAPHRETSAQDSSWVTGAQIPNKPALLESKY